ncbi:MAG: CHASE3 domain-containing protein [Sandaracinaceae bacterium]|nr:CHASE3 domain-containing protein [Sandaracinaceae bacterium]
MATSNERAPAAGAEPDAVIGARVAPASWAPHMPLRLRIIAAFASAILVLVVGASSLVAMQRTDALRRRVRSSRLLLLALGDVRADLERAVAGQRGFLLTHDRALLGPYARAAEAVRADLSALERTARDNPAQRRRAASLRPIVESRLRALARAVAEVAESPRPLDPTSSIDTQAGQVALTEIRTALATMRSSEEAALRSRVAERSASDNVTMGVVIGGTAIAFLLAIVVNTALQRGIGEQLRSRRIMEEQAARLSRQSQELADELARAALLTEQLTRSNSELVRTAAQHERAMEALAAKNLELDQFAYVASHDLKAPLRGISNLAHWIEEDLGDALTADVRQHINMMMGRVTRMEALIDGILQYARAGRISRPPVDVSVDSLLDEVVELLAPAENVVQLAKPFPHVVGDRTQLQQVFMNLVSNALKYGRSSGSTVRVGCVQRDTELEFFVSDNGPGIPPQHHERIFRMFQILSSRDAVESTGVGLAVVRKIVETRGGRVWVDSDGEHGATFRFTWPSVGQGL